MTSIQTSHRVLRQIALAIAISAIAAPAASARLGPPPNETAQGQTAPAILVVRPNPDQQTGRSGGTAPQGLRPARASDPAVHHRAHAAVNHATAPPLGTGNTPRGVAIGTHPLKPTVNDRIASTGTFAQTHSRLAHALYRPNSPGAGGASLATLTAIANASVAAPAAVAPPAITAPSDDFDYGAAALGAGITAAIVLLIGAGTLGLRRRIRPRHP